MLTQKGFMSYNSSNITFLKWQDEEIFKMVGDESGDKGSTRDPRVDEIVLSLLC